MWSQGQVHAAHRGKRKQVGSSYLGIWSGNWCVLVGQWLCLWYVFRCVDNKKIIFLVDIGLALNICDLGFMKVSYIVYNNDKL